MVKERHVVVIADSAISTTIRGGDGNDSIDLAFSAGVVKTIVEGDGSTTGLDTIRVDLGQGASSNTIDGGDGADSIVLSGIETDGGSNLYLGGTGADTIYFNNAGDSDVSGSTIKGEMGDDSILLEAISAGSYVSSVVYGNKGDDTITLSNGTYASAGSDSLTIQGGAGADLLTNSGVASAGTGVFSYAKYSDSTLDSMDTIGFNTAAISAGVWFPILPDPCCCFYWISVPCYRCRCSWYRFCSKRLHRL